MIGILYKALFVIIRQITCCTCGAWLLAIALTACLPGGALTSLDKTDNNLKSLQIPKWSELSISSLPSSSAHLGDVLATKEITSAPLRAVSVGSDGNVLLWDLAAGSGRLVTQLGGAIQFAALGRSHAVVAWSSGNTVTVACVVGCSERWELKKLKTRTTSLGFHEDDSALLIGGADGRVYRWLFQSEGQDLSADQRDRTLERYIAHQTLVSVVAPLHTGRAFFSADWDGQLYAWLAYTADDHRGSYDRTLFGGRFFGNLGNYMLASRPADRGITTLALSDNGQRLALGTDDGYVEVWEVRGFEMTARSLTHVGRVISVSLSHDGSRVASLGRDGLIAVADVVGDPSYGVKAGALRSTATQVFKEEVKSARNVYFLSSGDLLLSTSTGQIGEISLSAIRRAVTPAPLRVTPGLTAGEKGSDY
ncbi:MAG: WD40 repeat domain-containing protein [Pseudomonadota bacterium]|jgi:WD40 repeat protein